MSGKNREKRLLARTRYRSKKRRQRQEATWSSMQSESKPGKAKPEAPKGFSAILITQAITEFAKPLMEMAKSAKIKDINQVFRLATKIWNFKLPKNKEKSSQAEIVKELRKTFKITKREAVDLFDRMVERKASLFPEEIQPANSMMMFIRKEENQSSN